MKKMMLFAAAALVFAGCSKDENVDNWNGEIRLCSGLTVQQAGTRAATGIQSEQFDEDEKIDVFINEAVQSGQTATTTYPQPLVYTAGTNGAMNPATQPYFPTSGNGVTISAYYPHGVVKSLASNEPVTFSIKSDQSSEAEYKKSDLMYGKPASNPVSRTNSPVNIAFNHLLSKVTVELISGSGNPDLEGATVQLLNVLPNTSVTPAIGEISPATGTETDVTVFKATSDQLIGSAVVVPQTLNKEVNNVRRFIKVTLKGGGTLYSKDLKEEGSNNPIQDIVMESGKVYKYTITVNLTSLNITSSITKWGSTATVDGEAEMQPQQ